MQKAVLFIASVLFFSCIKRGNKSADSTLLENEVQSLADGVSKENCKGPDVKYLFSNSSSGLGNRLLVMAGAYSYAKITKRCWIQIWNVKTGVPSDFNQLFTNEFNMTKANGTDLSITSWAFNPFPKKEVQKNFESVEFETQIFGGETILPTDLGSRSVFLNSVTLTVLKNATTANQIQWASQFLRGLKPIPKIAIEVEKLLRPFENEPFIGIHLRTLSPEVGDKKVFPGPMTEVQFRKLFEQIPKSQHNFFVATDSPDMRNRLKSEILLQIPGSQVVTSDEAIRRDDLEGMIGALVELYALSKAELIYGTEGSTFSDVAALISKKQRKLFLGPKHIFASSANLTFGAQGQPVLNMPPY